MKMNISRLLETSKFASTDAGQQLADFIQYVADLAENVIRALQNQLTFQDNFNAKVSTISLKHNVEQVVNTDFKRPMGILPLQAISTTTGVDSLIWYVNNSGQTVVKVGLVGSPTAAVDVTLAILFP